MKTLTKRQKKVKELVGDKKLYSPKDAIKKLKEVSSSLKLKFDETLELAVRLGIDPKQSDQQVRSSVSLPGGTGKEIKICVIARGEKVKEAQNAGANTVGEPDDMIPKIEKGFMDFDKLVVTPEIMPQLAKLGKVLGPKGLMPNPKDGTVSTDLARTIKELKSGKVSFRAEKESGIIHAPIGKISFDDKNLLQNFGVVIESINKLKPASAKGIYIRSVYLSTTMGPSLKIDVNALNVSEN